MVSTTRWKSLATALFVARITQGVRSEFTTPRSDVKDNTQSWTTGEVLPIAWNSGWTQGLYSQPALVDLWITWFNRGGYTVKLKANISTKDAGSYNWTIDVPNEKIEGQDSESSYVLRFLNHTESETYPTTREMLPSKGFILHPSQKAVSSASMPTSTSSSAPSNSPTAGLPVAASPTPGSPTAGSAMSGSSQPSPSSSATKSSSNKGSNTGAIAGGVLGALVVVAVILVGVLFLMRRKKKQDAEKTGAVYQEAYSPQNGSYGSTARGPPVVYAHRQTEAELYSEPPPVELPAGHDQSFKHQPAELPRYEVDGSQPVKSYPPEKV